MKLFTWTVDNKTQTALSRKRRFVMVRMRIVNLTLSKSKLVSACLQKPEFIAWFVFCDLPTKLVEENKTSFHRLTRDKGWATPSSLISRSKEIITLEAETQMSNSRILSKLTEGDIIAGEACYHSKCITAYRNQYRKFINMKQNSGKDKKNLKILPLSTVCFLEDSFQADGIAPFIKLSPDQNF